jgi:deoxyribonuclease IV
MTIKKNNLLGAHLSAAGGLEQAIVRGDSIACDVVQLFTKSNQQWHARPISDDEAHVFKQTLADAATVQLVVAHAAYLINLASTNADVRNRSISGLATEIERCQKLAIPFLVLHPGSGNTDTLDHTLQMVSSGLDEALEKAPGTTMVLLETMAGQGNSIGSSFEQLAQIYTHTTHKKRVGICVDTCHIFAAGYDIHTEKGYRDTWHQFDTILGYGLLKVIHLNDSKKGCGERVDRHENIGHGKLGLETFKRILHDKNLLHVPKILETPKEEDLANDLRNLNVLRSLL